MVYLISLIIIMIVALNSYASKVVLFDPHNSRNQKMMQIGFVWLLPILGALVCLHILRTQLGTIISERKNVMEFADNGDASFFESDHSACSHHSTD